MASFELSREIEKDVFCLVTSVGQKKFRVPVRKQTPNLQSHRDPMVSEAYNKVHM